MPIYAYRCADCGHEKDVLRKLSDAPLTQCPACGKDSFSKQVTAAGFQLKGSGWYVTDFRGGNSNGGSKGNGSNADSANGSNASNAAESKSEGASGNSGSSDSAAPASTSSSDSAKPAAGTSASSGSTA